MNEVATFKEAEAFAGTILIERLDEVEEILRSRSFRMEGWASASAKSAPLMHGVLITMDGEPHLARRRLLARLLDDNALATFRDRHLKPTLDHCIAELAAMPREADGSVHADLVPLTQRSVYRTAAALTGIDGLGKPEEADRFIDMVLDMAAGLTVDWSRDDPDTVLKQAFAAREIFVRDFYTPSLARREKIVKEAKAAGRNPLEESGDILTLMLMLMHRDAEWAGGEDILLNESVAYLVGSSQTSALGFTNLVIRLEEWLKKHPGDRARIENDPEFLRRAVFESLRMTISTPVRQRKAVEDVTLSSGRTIKAGQVVSLHFIPANQDEAHFGAHTDQFDPTRTVTGTSPWGVCFSGGAHSCLGRPLVTGSRNPMGATSVDGTLATMCRRYYGVGLTLDPAHPPRRDPHTHYTAYESIPVIFRGLPAR